MSSSACSPSQPDVPGGSEAVLPIATPPPAHRPRHTSILQNAFMFPADGNMQCWPTQCWEQGKSRAPLTLRMLSSARRRGFNNFKAETADALWEPERLLLVKCEDPSEGVPLSPFPPAPGSLSSILIVYVARRDRRNEGMVTFLLEHPRATATEEFSWEPWSAGLPRQTLSGNPAKWIPVWQLSAWANLCVIPGPWQPMAREHGFIQTSGIFDERRCFLHTAFQWFQNIVFQGFIPVELGGILSGQFGFVNSPSMFVEFSCKLKCLPFVSWTTPWGPSS